MRQNSTATVPPYLVWVIPEDIFNSFSAAPRLEIAKEMRSLGWRVDLIASGAVGRHVVQGVDVLCFPQPNVYLIRQVIYHLSIIRHILQNWKQIDVILFHHVSLPWLLPLRLLNMYRCPSPIFVMDTRTVPMESVEKATLKDKIRGEFYYLMNTMANRLTDGQTAITQRMADLLNIPREKLWGAWPSGVNVEMFSAASTERQWPVPHDFINVIYIGSLSFERNLITLCEAIIDANQAGMKFKLLLYGEGTAKNDLQALADKYPESITVFSRVAHNQIPGALSGAHIGVLPFPDEDKYRVSSPIKLFEYMGAGMPILATKIVCHTDVVGDDDYVFWAESSDVKGTFDALQKIWHARSSLAAMGEKSLNAANNWTYKASAKKLSNALQHGLSTSRKDKMAETNNL
jgi:glycosyltransferase involved in cell wall biosynthesis